MLASLVNPICTGRFPNKQRQQGAHPYGPTFTSSRLGMTCHIYNPIVSNVARRPASARAAILDSSSQPSEEGKAWITIFSNDELKAQLAEATSNKKLVVLEILDDEVCEAGFDEPVPELHWKLDVAAEKERQLEECHRLSSAFRQMATDAQANSDLVFLEMTVSGHGESHKQMVMQDLGVTVVPTLQLYDRRGSLMWQQQGSSKIQETLGAGLMYYGDTAPGGERASDWVTELTSQQDMHKFITGAGPDTLVVVDVSLARCGPCVRVFPAVLGLAKSFKGYVQFGRLLGDNCPQLLKDLRIMEVPTFLFYRAGQEIGRSVSSNRGDLIGHILLHQQAAGLSLPPPPPRAAKTSSATNNKTATKARVSRSKW